MQKGVNKGIYSCISRTGFAKSAWKTADEVIQKAKHLNRTKDIKKEKLVGYKCPVCFMYHLKTVYKKLNYEN